jgi:hypothetical protein
LITSAKKLLQQDLPKADSCRKKAVARMHEAKSGAILEGAYPGYRFHPGYDPADRIMRHAQG